MAKNSRTKGKVGELEVAALLRDYGFEARRGQQFSGGSDSPDVVHSIPNVHLEVKRVEAFSLYPALEQADRDRDNGEIPVVFHRISAEAKMSPRPDVQTSFERASSFTPAAPTPSGDLP